MDSNVISISILQTVITIGVAIAAFVSPVVVAIINNRSSRKIRKLELEHDEVMKKIDCNHALSVERLHSVLSSKNQAFMNLIDCLSKFYENPSDNLYKTNLVSSMYKAAMYCEDAKIQNNVFSMIYMLKSDFSGASDKTLDSFASSMESLVYALQFEMSGSKPEEHTKD